MHTELRCEELTLANRDTDFATRYMAAAGIHKRMRQQPELASPRTICTLEAALTDPSILGQRQSLNLCMEAAGALAAVFVAKADEELSDAAVSSLQGAIQKTSGAGYRAVTATLGSLPIPINAPNRNDCDAPAIEQTCFDDLLAASGNALAGPITEAGRSLIAPLTCSDRLLVVKLARSGDDPCGLWQEAAWLSGLENILVDCPADCHIPQAVRLHGSHAFRLKNVPETISYALHPEKLAIAFVARRDYFTYPNGDAHHPVLPPEQCREVLQRSAELLGWLAARGLIHTAPIPLFHNRVQGERREDNGLYDWTLGGRLDQWLSSCRHPNFGASGLRDFEHLEIMAEAGPRLHWHLGMHFFSLLLVAGSCFRFRAPEQTGLDRDGQPADARHLFNAGQLETLIESIFTGYYRGFVGEKKTPTMPFSAERLATRMIEEMGVDRHMEEQLRVQDQVAMTDEQFQEFLSSRGYTPTAANQMSRGEADIVLYTGPHLGRFNDRISLPELIDASSAMTAICVLDRYQTTLGRN